MIKMTPFSTAISLLIILVPVFCSAKTDETVVARICQNHAETVANEIRQKVLEEMTSEQYRQTLLLVSKDCLRQFTTQENKQAIVTETIEEDSDDWFTRYVLEGKAPDKAGNRRLERMRRK